MLAFGFVGDLFRQAVLAFISSILSTLTVPARLVSAVAWLLDKNNNKQECHAWRLIHGMPTFGRAFFAALWKDQPLAEAQHGAVGCIQGRSREEAVAGQMIITHRLNIAGYLSVVDYHDLRSAFQSFTFQQIESVVEGTPVEGDTALFKQYVSKASFV